MKKIEKYLGDFGLKILKGFVLEKNIETGEIDLAGIKNILFVIRHQMGDMLCATPMMRSVRSFYPDAHITLVTKQSTRYEEIFKDNNSSVDEVKYFEHGFENFINLAKELREQKIDMAIIPSTVDFSATNHLIAYYSGAKIRVGVKSMDYEVNKVSFLLNIKGDFVWGTKKIHQIERNLDIIRQLNIKPLESSIRLDIKEKNREFAQKFIQEKFGGDPRSVISFHPGAAKEGNVWNPAKFSEIAYRLYSKFGCNILISEGPLDTKYVNEMDSLLREKYNLSNIARHKGLLMNNLALISLSVLFVTNDTGLMHMAAGLETPEIAVFGATRAFEWGPIGKNKLSIQASNQTSNQASKSSIDEISVNTVYEAILSFFKDKK